MAMAENLGLAWKDLNSQLEQRKVILHQVFFSLPQPYGCFDNLIDQKFKCRKTLVEAIHCPPGGGVPCEVARIVGETHEDGDAVRGEFHTPRCEQVPTDFE